MKSKGLCEKGIVSLIEAWISNMFGILLSALGLLVLLMVVDYIFGMMAAKKKHMKILMIENMDGEG